MSGQDEGSSIKTEARYLARLAAPTILMTASQQAMTFTDQIFLGHIGTEEMAAAALGNMYSAFLQFFLFGMATALDTLGATAYGAEKRGLSGTSLVTWCYTTFIVLTVLCFPVSAGLLAARPVATQLLSQDAGIADLMAEFCAWLVPGVWPMMWSIILMKFLQVQNVVLSPALVTLLTFLANIGLNFGLIRLSGFKGAPRATSLSRALQCLLMCLLVYCFERTKGQGKRTGFWRILFSDAEADDGLVQPSCTEGEITQPAALANSPQHHHHNFARASSAESGNAAAQEGSLASVAVANGHHHSQPPATRRDSLDSSQDLEGGPALQGEQAEHQGLLQEQQHQQKQKQARQKATQGTQICHSGMRIPSSSHPLHQQAGWKAALAHGSKLLRGAARPALLWAFLKLGLPGGMMQSLEQASFDVTTAMAGQLGPTVVAAHSAMLNVIGLTFVSCPFAVGIAGSIRVGNLLGAGQPKAARLCSWLCVAVGGTFMAANALIILLVRDDLGRAFSKDEAVIKVIALIAPLGASFQVSDGIMGTAQGVLRGCGKQTLLMVYNFVGFWGCGVLLGAFLCFKWNYGVVGLWWGIFSGDTLTAILNTTTLGLVRWDEESRKAQETLLKSAEQDAQDDEAESSALLPASHV